MGWLLTSNEAINKDKDKEKGIVDFTNQQEKDNVQLGQFLWYFDYFEPERH